MCCCLMGETSYFPFLFIGIEVPLSRWIRDLDGGQYSHGAVYDGEEVVEAAGKGVTRRPLAEEVEAQAYVDVYRFRSNSGDHLGDPAWPVQPIVDRAHHYYHEGAKYSYVELFLLGQLAVIKKARIPKVIPHVKDFFKVLNHILDALQWLNPFGKEPVTCSEFVYRVFDEAQSEPRNQYTLTVKDLVSLQAFAKLLKHEEVEGIHALEDQESDEVKAALDDFSKQFLQLWTENKKYSSSDIQSFGAAPKGKAMPDFVTPFSLEKSSNLIFQGRILKP